MLFTGNQIRLRKMTLEDAPTYHKWQNDMEIAPLVNPFIDLQSLDETEEQLKSALMAENRKKYIIEHIEDAKPVGYIGLFNINHHHKNAECYIAVCDTEYHGKRIGEEAMKLMMDFVFLELNLHRLSLRVFASNERAIHMYKKLGFIQEGRLRETRYHNGKWQDSFIMSVLHGDFVAGKTKNM